MEQAPAPALVSTQWLKDVLNDKEGDYRILDCSWFLPGGERSAEKEYKQQHLPGALFYDMEECVDKCNEIPYMLPSTGVFEKYVCDLGVNNDTHVVVYDKHGQFPLCSAQRIWWTFRVFGHKRVSILEGGLRKWIADNGPTTDVVEDVPKGTFRAEYQPGMVKAYEDIEQNLKDPVFLLVDARCEGRYLGLEPELKPGCGFTNAVVRLKIQRLTVIESIPENDITDSPSRKVGHSIHELSTTSVILIRHFDGQRKNTDVMGSPFKATKRVKPGCVPHAINIPFTTTLDLDNQRMKRPEDLRKLFAAKGVDLEKPLVAHCSFGTTAVVLALAAFQCGNDKVAIYDGSWTEWYLKAPSELKLNVPATD